MKLQQFVYDLCLDAVPTIFIHSRIIGALQSEHAAVKWPAGAFRH